LHANRLAGWIAGQIDQVVTGLTCDIASKVSRRRGSAIAAWIACEVVPLVTPLAYGIASKGWRRRGRRSRRRR
jgi:hypothetical protein